MLTPQEVARLGNKWYAATNKGIIASILRGIVIANNLDGYCEIYDKMRAVEPKQGSAIVHSFTRTSQHAGRQHREQVGQIVARLFAQTTDLEMEYVKETVFGDGGGAPIVAKDRPAMQERFKTRASASMLFNMLYIM